MRADAFDMPLLQQPLQPRLIIGRIFADAQNLNGKSLFSQRAFDQSQNGCKREVFMKMSRLFIGANDQHRAARQMRL